MKRTLTLLLALASLFVWSAAAFAEEATPAPKAEKRAKNTQTAEERSAIRLEKYQEALAKQVEAGVLTQEQADALLALMQAGMAEGNVQGRTRIAGNDRRMGKAVRRGMTKRGHGMGKLSGCPGSAAVGCPLNIAAGCGVRNTRCGRR